jgi:mRNA-degrading endonuclease toxin of MazEF toxin-antitoxin module
MTAALPPKQWDIWFAVLRQGRPGEQTGDHNVLVVSSPLMQSDSRVVIVAPITSSGRTNPWVVQVEPQDSGLEVVSWIECDQLQALSPSPERFKTFRKRLAAPRRPEVALALQNALRGALPDRS